MVAPSAMTEQYRVEQYRVLAGSLEGRGVDVQAVKARLLDQSTSAGVGNLRADEALWQARISPQAPAGSLSRPAVSRLYHSLQAALASAEANGGVHTGEVIAARRRGGVCPRCGAPMRQGVVGGRTTWWCSREQAPRRAAGARAPRRATV